MASRHEPPARPGSRRADHRGAGRPRVRLLLRHQRLARHAALCVHRKRPLHRGPDRAKDLDSQRCRRARLRGRGRAAGAHAEGGRDHRPARGRREGGAAVFPLPAADLAAHAHRAHARVEGQKRARRVWRLRDADRRRRRRGAGRPGQSRPRRKHARHFHQRQRLLADGRHREAGGAGPLRQRGVARLQSRHLGRWTSRAFPRALAGAGKSRHAPRARDLPHRLHGDLRGNPRRKTSRYRWGG